MPFQSKAQARAAFGGYLGPEMRDKADEFAKATPGGIKRLPTHVKRTKVREAVMRKLKGGK